MLDPRPIPEVKLYSCFHFTIIRETGELVTCGQKNKDEPWYLYFFTMQGKQIKERKQDFLCSHDIYCFSLLSICVHNQEYLALSCMNCKDIKLLNLKTHKVTKAFGTHDTLYSMCNGESNRLYVHCNRTILELDCSDLTFKTIQTIPVDNSIISCMSYVPSPHSLIIVTDRVYKKIEAICTQSKKLVWKFNRIGGAGIQPEGCVFLPSHNAVLVSDFSVVKIITLDPTNGSHMKTIPIGNVHLDSDLCLYNDQVFGVGYDNVGRHY